MLFFFGSFTKFKNVLLINYYKDLKSTYTDI